MTLPRIVLAAPASGHGKTTVATGLMAALRLGGHRVSGHKVGPDYIDPGYHALATKRPGRNLDPHLVGEDAIVPLMLHGAQVGDHPTDIAVVEGVMGLYDGAIGTDGFSSTAHVATLLQAPVVLVVDVSHLARSVAAVVHGMATYDPSVHVAGVIVNKVGSQRHADEVRRALQPTGIPVLGLLGRDEGVAAPSRHLGLVPAEERADAASTIERLAAQVARRVDLRAVMRIARSAPPLAGSPWSPQDALAGAGLREPPHGDGPLVAVAGGRAFTFRYTETDELIQAAGCRIAEFDPLTSERLPRETAAVYLGGGFPEVHAGDLSANVSLRAALRSAVASGVPTVAECAGMLYLTRSIDGTPMVGALPATSTMTPTLTLAYRKAIAPDDTLSALAGTSAIGHEFHRTATAPDSGVRPAWVVDGRPIGFAADPAKTGRSTVHASYLHLHWAGLPQAAARFSRAAHTHVFTREERPRRTAGAAAMRPWAGSPSCQHRPARDPGERALRHHGDQETHPALVDLAVNVHHGPWPCWLEEALRASLADLRAYPDATAARESIANRHGRAPAEVLPTAGGAEAFTLVARMRDWQHPVVVHPQFTEPEAALRAAGHTVHRVVLRAGEGFELDAADVPENADLVVIGNPTNPTGVLHPASMLRRLVRRGRTVVVDEAFMDAVPGERESLASSQCEGLVVVRSLTKTWSIPGARAGYLVADAPTVEALARHQPPWSVSSMSAAAMVACTTREAVAEAERRACNYVGHRAALVSGLGDLGLPVSGHPVTPFVLVRGRPAMRGRLRRRGYAVRRGDTFPGLGKAWMRIAVRDSATTRAFLTAVADVCEELSNG